jgi:cytochrome c oxidase cbb3-type subunit 3
MKDPTFWSDPINSPMLPVYMVTTFLVIAIILTGLVMTYVLKVLRLFVRQEEMERAKKSGIRVEQKVSWWSKFWQRINAFVPVSQERDIDTGHEYDGIRELDNHLPPWWTGLFYATILWSVVYIVVYHVTDSFPLSQGEYAAELVEAAEQSRALLASQPPLVFDEATLDYSADEAILTNGKAVFSSSNCGSCHRNDGGGNGVGPNLTDEYWLHGGSVGNIFSTINKGVVDKGMPAWGKVMSPKDVRDVAFYIMSLQRNRPIDAKAPQGDLYKPGATTSDSLKTQALNH